MKKLVFYVLIALLVVTLSVIIGFSIYFSVTTRDIELDIKRLEHIELTTVLDMENNALTPDRYLKYEEIPSNLIRAFIAIEDKRYLEHNGIDIKRMISALIYNITHGKKAQGASTITQQLIKNTYLTQDKTIERKLKEIKLALKLEKTMSKEQIMEKYLNSLYFGNGIYGIYDASRYIFGKNIDELNLSECATLAGIIKAPLYYSPLNDLTKSQDRRDLVLSQMLDNGFIDNKLYYDAINENIITNNELFYSNYMDNYLNQAVNEAGIILNLTPKEVMSKGYTIATYCDKNKQRLLFDAMKSCDKLIDKHNYMAILSDNKSSSINAICTDIKENMFKYHRQVGSTMKPLAVYLPCLEYGLISPITQVNDTKTTFNGYCPSNYHDVYRGKISVRDAVKYSSNIVPVQLLNALGIDKSKDFLSKMNINIADNGLSIALGGLKDGLSPIDLINGYQSIANSGYMQNNSFIRYIKDDNGNIIYRRNEEKTKIYDDSTAYLMTNMLVDTAKNGTARKLASLPYSIASKTGTVQDINDKDYNIDAYNMSYTSKDTLLVWMGGKMPSNIQGGANPTIITREIYEKLYKTTYPEDFIKPNSVKELLIDRKIYGESGEILLTNDLNKSIKEIFDVRYLPKNKIINEKDIEITRIDDEIHLKGVEDTMIKIYRYNLFKEKTLLQELYSTNDIVILPYKHYFFDNYLIEIYYRDKLIKDIIIN